MQVFKNIVLLVSIYILSVAEKAFFGIIFHEKITIYQGMVVTCLSFLVLVGADYLWERKDKEETEGW